MHFRILPKPPIPVKQIHISYLVKRISNIVSRERQFIILSYFEEALI